MKPNVIESRLLVNAEHTFPPRSIGRRRIAVRVNGAIDVAAQKQPVIIQQQMLAITAECAEAELNRSLIHRLASNEALDQEFVKFGMEFVPRSRRLVEYDLAFNK